MSQQYNYDDTGTMFSLFLLSVLALVLIPSTFWSFSLLFKSSAKSSTAECTCKDCVNRRSRISLKKKKQDSSIPVKEILIALGWVFAAYLTYKVATARYEEAVWDPWELLGLNEGVTDSQIKKAFRSLSLKYHPDKVDSSLSEAMKEELNAKYIEIGKAYKVLTDEEARQRWEEFGHPDGKQSLTLGIALPTWLVSSSNSILVLLVYAGIFGIGLPVLVARWWYTSKNATKDGVLHITMAKIYQELKENITIRGLLDLLTFADEFKDVKVDLNSPEVIKLTNQVKDRLMEASGETFGRTNKYGNMVPWSNKVLLLLYAHLLRVPIDDPTLLEEQESVVAKSIHLIGGLMQISLARSWLNVSQLIIELSQHLVQGVYINQPPNAQLPKISPDILKHFKKGKRSVHSIKDFLDLSEEEQKLLLKSLDENEQIEVLNVAKQYPVVRLEKAKFYVPNDPFITPSSYVTLSVKIGINKVTEQPETIGKLDLSASDNTPEDEKEEKIEWWLPKNNSNVIAHAPLFPEEKSPVWWVFIADKKNNRVITVGVIKDLEKRTVKLQFQAPPKPGTVELQLYVKSDSYLGCDLMENVKFVVKPPDVLPVVEIDDDISDPEEDSIAGQMQAMRAQKKKTGTDSSQKKPAESDDETDSETDDE